MGPDSRPRTTTGEYDARWQTVVEDHLFSDLSKSVRQLAGIEPTAGGPGPEQAARLAYHLAHALRVAASSSGGFQASVEYLQWAAAAQDPAPNLTGQSSESNLVACLVGSTCTTQGGVGRSAAAS